jgi:hypothetical protein
VCASEQTIFGGADILVKYPATRVVVLVHACACLRSGGGEQRKQVISLDTILLIVLILLLVGVLLPAWPHARS